MRIRVVAVANRIVLNAARAAAWNDGLERADLAGLKRSGDPARERQFVERVNPIRSVIELPIGMPIVAWRVVDRGDSQIMNHPSLIPARFIIDDEQAGDIRKDVNESPDIIRVGW